MTAPPLLEDTLHERMGEVRSALEDVLSNAPAVAAESARQVLDSDALIEKVTEIVEKKLFRKIFRKIVWTVGGLVTVILLLAGFGYARISSDAQTINDRFTNQDAAFQRSQDTISAFRSQLDTSNDKLRALGLPTVSAPADVQPGSPEQAALINAAATASTLARIPQQVGAQPDTQAVASAAAKAVADYFAVNPVQVGLTPQNVIDQVAAYLAANPMPGPVGPQGERGDPGAPPTAAQITDAFTSAVRDNPQLLCPAGGTYTTKTVQLAGGGTSPQFGCWGSETSPPDPDPPAAVPQNQGGIGTGNVQTTPPAVDPPPPSSDPASPSAGTPSATPDPQIGF